MTLLTEDGTDHFGIQCLARWVFSIHFNNHCPFCEETLLPKSLLFKWSTCALGHHILETVLLEAVPGPEREEYRLKMQKDRPKRLSIESYPKDTERFKVVSEELLNSLVLEPAAPPRPRIPQRAQMRPAAFPESISPDSIFVMALLFEPALSLFQIWIGRTLLPLPLVSLFFAGFHAGLAMNQWQDRHRYSTVLGTLLGVLTICALAYIQQCSSVILTSDGGFTVLFDSKLLDQTRRLYVSIYLHH